MSKRPAPNGNHYQPPHKKRSNGPSSSPSVPTAPTLPAPLPPLPQLIPEYAAAPFIHKSAGIYSRAIATQDLSYERLEFLGDAYIELFATKLIFTRCPYLPAGPMSQLRELLVKNETLAEYSRAYGFDKKIEVDSMRHMEAAASKGNKGLNKVFGDVFEAYIAAVVLSDAQNGFTVAENWTLALWEPRIVAWEKANAKSAHGPPAAAVSGDSGGDPLNTYNPDAKQELSRRIVWSGKEVKITYEPWRDMIELKGDQKGQTHHFVAVYLTGYGVEKKLLGKGEGKNRGEAGQWAATNAIYGDMKDFVAECAQTCVEMKEKKRLQEEKDRVKE